MPRNEIYIYIEREREEREREREKERCIYNNRCLYIFIYVQKMFIPIYIYNNPVDVSYKCI